jgi:predicted RNA-binding protein YlxR (DUF448 family)
MRVRRAKGGRLSGTGPEVRQPPTSRTAPERTCVGCRRKADRSRLLRVVAAGAGHATPAGAVVLVPDPRARLPGRGAWLHPDPGCLDQAVRRRAFARALRLQAPVDLTAVHEHLEQLPPARPAREHDHPTVEIGSGSASDGHPMSTQQ